MRGTVRGKMQSDPDQTMSRDRSQASTWSSSKSSIENADYVQLIRGRHPSRPKSALVLVLPQLVAKYLNSFSISQPTCKYLSRTFYHAARLPAHNVYWYTWRSVYSDYLARGTHLCSQGHLLAGAPGHPCAAHLGCCWRWCHPRLPGA